MTIIDEDILNVEHVIGTMTSLGIIITVCHACIPNEVRRLIFLCGVGHMACLNIDQFRDYPDCCK